MLSMGHCSLASTTLQSGWAVHSFETFRGQLPGCWDWFEGNLVDEVHEEEMNSSLWPNWWFLQVVVMFCLSRFGASGYTLLVGLVE